MATTDTDTDYAINKTPLPLTAIAHPICSMLANSCQKVHSGQGSMRYGPWWTWDAMGRHCGGRRFGWP